MARPRLVPDDRIFAALRHILSNEGEKAVSFASIARVTGLAGATLVQRYGSRDGMIRAALAAGWDELEARTKAAAETADTAQALLKALGSEAMGAGDLALLAIEFRDAALRARAEAWRIQVETALQRHLKDTEAAAMLFAAWQGQMLWQMAGGKGFRLKDAAKRLA